jgi:hypothetical protein
MGTYELASQVLSRGTFVLRTTASTSPFEMFGTTLEVCVRGLQDDKSLLSGISNGQMDWPTVKELANKMVRMHLSTVICSNT